MAGDSPRMPVRACSRRRSISRRTVAVTSAGSAGFSRKAVSPSSRASALGSGSVCSTSPRVEIERSCAIRSSWAADDSCSAPVRTMQSGGAAPVPTTRRTSSNDEASVVWKPAVSRWALTRTACSRSSVVIKTRSAISYQPSVGHPLAVYQLDGVIQEALQDSQPIRHSARRAGEVHDQRLPPRARDPTGEPGAGKVGRGGGAQRLGDPGGSALEHGLRGLGGDVPLGEPRAAGRGDHVDLTLVRPPDQLGGNAVGRVRYVIRMARLAVRVTVPLRTTSTHVPSRNTP